MLAIVFENGRVKEITKFEPRSSSTYKKASFDPFPEFTDPCRISVHDETKNLKTILLYLKYLTLSLLAVNFEDH